MSNLYTLEGYVYHTGEAEEFKGTLEIHIINGKKKRKTAYTHLYGAEPGLEKMDLIDKWLILTGFFVSGSDDKYVLMIIDYKIDTERKEKSHASPRGK